MEAIATQWIQAVNSEPEETLTQACLSETSLSRYSLRLARLLQALYLHHRPGSLCHPTMISLIVSGGLTSTLCNQLIQAQRIIIDLKTLGEYDEKIASLLQANIAWLSSSLTIILHTVRSYGIKTVDLEDFSALLLLKINDMLPILDSTLIPITEVIHFAIFLSSVFETVAPGSSAFKSNTYFQLIKLIVQRMAHTLRSLQSPSSFSTAPATVVEAIELNSSFAFWDTKLDLMDPFVSAASASTSWEEISLKYDGLVTLCDLLERANRFKRQSIGGNADKFIQSRLDLRELYKELGDCHGKLMGEQASGWLAEVIRAVLAKVIGATVILTVEFGNRADGPPHLSSLILDLIRESHQSAQYCISNFLVASNRLSSSIRQLLPYTSSIGRPVSSAPRKLLSLLAHESDSGWSNIIANQLSSQPLIPLIESATPDSPLLISRRGNLMTLLVVYLLTQQGINPTERRKAADRSTGVFIELEALMSEQFLTTFTRQECLISQ